MKSVVHFVFLVLALWVYSGCAAPIQNTSKLQYLAPEFKQGSLAEGGLSLLPVVAGAGQEGLRRPLGDKLNKYLGNRLPEGKFIGNLGTMDLINNAGLTENYSRLIEDYNRSAILNKASLIKIGEAIGVEYLLYVKLLEQSRTGGVARAVLSNSIIETEEIRINIFGQVWSCVMGDVVWEGTGEISVAKKDELTVIKQTVDELVDIAARSFLNNLPR